MWKKGVDVVGLIQLILAPGLAANAKPVKTALQNSQGLSSIAVSLLPDLGVLSQGIPWTIYQSIWSLPQSLITV